MERIIEAWLSGNSVQRICDDYAFAEASIYRILREEMVSRRGWKGETTREHVRDCYALGLSAGESLLRLSRLRIPISESTFFRAWRAVRIGEN